MLEAQRADLSPGAEVSVAQGPPRPVAAGSMATDVGSGLFVGVSQSTWGSAGPEVVTIGQTSGTANGLEVAAGTILSATLITGLNSDLPGVVLAQITDPVFGSRLIGRYERATGARQERINVGWDKLVMPDGRVVTLKGALAADELGFVGLEGRVNYHPGALAKGLRLSTILALGDRRAGPFGSS